jgi:hypothetical protein
MARWFEAATRSRAEILSQHGGLRLSVVGNRCGAPPFKREALLFS